MKIYLYNKYIVFAIIKLKINNMVTKLTSFIYNMF